MIYTIFIEKKIRKRRNQKKIPTPKTEVGKNQTNNQDPVVQSIVSLTISLRHKFVKDRVFIPGGLVPSIKENR